MIEFIIGTLVGAFLYAAGIYTGIKIKKEQPAKQKQPIKRIVPSMRNPMKTYDVRYSKYESKDGLLTPQKPKSEAK